MHPSSFSEQKVHFLLLTGASGCGKTSLLRDLADSQGFSFATFDSLSGFNIPSVKKLFAEQIPAMNTGALLLELSNFDKYRMLIDQFSQGTSKSKKDLTEMRFVQTFQQAMSALEARMQSNKEAKVLIVATCEKQDDVIHSFSRQFKDKFAFIPPEKADRELVIDWLLSRDETLRSVGVKLEIA